MCALTSLFNWFLTANIMTIYFSSNLIEGSFAVKYFEGSRTFIGVILAGNVTCAIIFLSVEKSCALVWPHFFPDGGLIKTPAVFRLRLHVRMLVIFGLASVMPIILMAVLSYNKARMMLVLPPQDVIGSLLYLTAFLLVVALATAIYLSGTFSNSIIAPVRSSLRQRASLIGNIAQIMSDRNRQLVQDVEDSGQFMTMFFLTLNTATRQLEWVRAGHDPGIVYDPGSDSFGELGGPGIALGVDAEWVYEDNKKTDFSKGQIIILSTDGIWEARNKKGEMLGKKPILSAIRKNSSSGATQIIDSIFNTLNTFSDGVKIEDDITAVVIKMLI